MLRAEYGDKITIAEYFPFYQFTDRHVTFLYDNSPILNIYGNNKVCTPYFYLEKKKINIATYLYTVMMCLILSQYYKIYTNSDEEKNMNCMLSTLIKLRQQYLDKHNKTVLDDTPFKEFVLNCIGESYDSKLMRLIAKKNVGMKKPFVFQFRYNYGGITPDTSRVRFANTSGGIIVNEKQMITTNAKPESIAEPVEPVTEETT
ncbi:MAG: putative polyadenylate polymerase catalytic subunit [Faunusvirus sp.]|uniref:Putative polyadenylate polymerase catalytic subunit n=1 Tax=Faunusvirus sp. TaxID=2487766 RepID=A0A3G4ZX72_9VIRU|nr:MAG: putative polyadenylate polymerase catalytic subunit [Faunusvirus sp.]